MSTTAERTGRLARLALVALAVCTSGCASDRGGPVAPGIDPALADLSWLVGVWEAGDAAPGEARPMQIEHWQVHDDGSLVAANYQRLGTEVVPHQNMAVRRLADGSVVLEVTGYELIGDRAVPVPEPSYKMVEHGPGFARFEGPPSVSPRAILYQRGPQGQMVISIVMPSANGEREFFVAFKHVENN